MKTLIVLSGLAGFLWLGAPLSPRSFPAVRHPAAVPVQSAHTLAAQRASSHDSHLSIPEGQDRCRYQGERRITVPVEVGQDLRLEAGSGSLEVVGVDGLTEIRGIGRACASHEEFLESLDLTWEERGSSILVETWYPDDEERSGWGNRYARLDLRLEVPEGFNVEIRDSSGGMTVSDVGALRIDDGSGEIELRSVSGDLRIDDGSGEMEILDVLGSIEIDDGSGEIRIEGVGGGVIISDGSGEIDIREVEETVQVIQDGSGSIGVDGVGGDFIVRRDGSGSIDFRDVAGRVDIPRRHRRF